MIQGNNITLRLYRSEEEVKEVLERYNTLNERSPLDHTEIYSLQKILSRFRESGSWGQNNGTLVITDKEDRIVGSISFNRKSELELSLGYRIYRNEDRKKGYMSEALSLFSFYLFQTMPCITRLSLYTAENNIASRKLAEKCGYTLDGILRDAYFYRGEVCSHAVYSLLRHECTGK